MDIVFHPSVEDMYPEGYQTYVEVTEITKYLCGRSRPGHFRGVTTVVAKLFNIVKPHIAIFGMKDYQQLKVIERMVRDLNFDIEIVGVPIVREEDGLAMSSRNTYLSPEERVKALSIYRALEKAKELFRKGERNADKIRDLVSSMLEGEIDYVSVCDPESFEELDVIKDKALLAVAVKIGKARLIDNTILGGG